MVLLPGVKHARLILTKLYFMLQKRVLRLLYFADWYDHVNPLFLEANVLPITFLYYESKSALMHDINNNNNNKGPISMSNLFQEPSDIHSYNTRSSTSRKLDVKSSRLEIQNNSFSRLGVKLWNLPKKAFKRVLRKLLFDILAIEDYCIEIPLIIIKKLGY